MKTININGIELKYELKRDTFSNDSHNTTFYWGTETITYKKYWLFGETITKVRPKYAFTVWRNIEDENYSREDVRGFIEKELVLLQRRNEIKRGKII